MGTWFALGVVVAISAVLVFKALAKRSILRGRTPLPLEEIYASVKDDLSYAVFNEVWTVLGKAYSLDPKMLRPMDTFLALGKMDSWTLGKGEDAIGDWLKTRGLGTPPQLHTLLEFAKWVQSSPTTASTQA